SGDAIAAVGKIFVNTTLSPALAASTAMILSWIVYGKSDVSMSLNGALAGLAAITAGCDAMQPGFAALTGIMAGFVVIGGLYFIENILHLDDPVGAISVHGLCGALGLLCVGLFSDGSGAAAGLFCGGGLDLLGVQALGVVSVSAYVIVAMLIIFRVLKQTCGVRLSVEDEIDGLDIHEHNIHSYSDFLSSDGVSAPKTNIPKILGGNLESPLAHERPDSEVTLTSVVIVTRQSKLDSLLNAMNKIGVTGVTVSQVTGYGLQRGQDYYRGAEIDLRLLPKVKVEIIISTVPVSLLIETVEKVLYTGKHGDGKIFIYDVREAVKVRTGETGAAALADAEAGS
ncbi:MAG: adenylate cyclase, partial [Gracilibacteraceae bacterium]|nr:adenylate cyclase [Gracilibacteraceae bacterium]